MIHETINLPVQYRDKGVQNGNWQPTLTTYIIRNSDEYSKGRRRPLVLVCPGGAYMYRSDREAEPVALRMNAAGFDACVLNYSIKPMDFPAAFLDVCEAVHYIRQHADEWCVDPAKICVAGFSAGGHLAASFGCWWNSGLMEQYLPYKACDIRPNALLLGYPVITSGPYAHRDTITYVMGSKASDELQQKVSLETQVTKDVPPVFLWHTYDDEWVPVENSFYFAAELKKLNIPLEMHIFAHGHHGLSLATADTAHDHDPEHMMIQEEVQIWPDMFARWLRNLKA